MMHLSGAKLTTPEMMQALIVDSLQFLCWTKTKNARKGTNKPKSLYASLVGAKKRDELMSFSTPEEYEAYIRNKNG